MSIEQSQLKKSIQDHAKARNFPYEVEGDSINTLLIGEHHQKYARLHAAWIRFTRPSKVLLEPLGGFQFDPSAKQLTLPEGRLVLPGKEETVVKAMLAADPKQTAGGLKPIVDACEQVGAQMIGCDMTATEIAIWVIRNKINLDSMAGHDRLHKHRDQVIYEYLRRHQGTPNSLTMAIIGFNHANRIITQNQTTPQLTDFAFIGHIPS